MSARNQSPALWLVLYLGCLVEALALASLHLPWPEVARGVFTFMLALVAVLGAVVIGIGVWRLSGSVKGDASTSRWVVLTVLVLAAMAAWLAVRAVLPDPGESLALLLLVLGLAVVLAVLLALAARALVFIVADNRRGVSSQR